MSVKILELEAENVKRIKAIQITPAETGLTVIGGENNQGKTSVLDALAWALGGDKYRPNAAQRDGASTPPRLHVKLSNGLVVDRKGKNGALTVTDPAGRKGGQQLLSEFVEQLALDLPRFMASSDREKADTLLKIIGVGDKLGELDRSIKSLYDRRTAIGQIAEQKKHYADEMIEYHDAPEEMVSVSELIRQQQDILARNGENQRKRQRANDLEQQKQELRRQLDILQERYGEVCRDCDIACKSAADLQDESTTELETSLQNVEEINRKVRANADKAHAEEEAGRYADQYDQLTDQIDTLRRSRTDLLNGADLPLPELSVQDGALTYKGKLWRDMSGSDQLMVSAAIVRKLNPNCGFVLLDKLEQMDLHTLRDFGDWLSAEGLQAIATRVSTGGECQIIIDDGRVMGQDEPIIAAAPPTAPTWAKGAF